MSESPLRRSGRALPWGLLGMLALVGAVERTVIRGNLALRNGRAESWGRTARDVKPARGCDVLLFGDSLVKSGLIPRALGRGTGRSTFNLAVVGGSAPSSYFLLRRA